VFGNKRESKIERQRAKEERAQRRTAKAPSSDAGLTGEQQRLLAAMREDNLRTEQPFRASEYWQGLNRRFDAWFAEHSIADVEEQPYNRLFSGADPKSSKFFEYAVWMLYDRVRARDVDGVLERVQPTGKAGKRMTVELGGRPLSWDLLISVDTLLSLQETVGGGLWTDPVVVADLGAGWGRIGHALLSINPRATYVAIDLPESLLVASEYLPRLLPGAPVIGYESARGPGRIAREHFSAGGLWFLGTHDLPRVADGGVDCLVNVASFQEMTREQVGAYLSVADRVAARAVYLQEIWDARRHHLDEQGAIAGIDEYAFPAHWKRVFLRNATFSEKVFEAGFRL